LARRHRLVHQLERDAAARLLLLRFVHRAHASDAELAQQPVASDVPALEIERVVELERRQRAFELELGIAVGLEQSLDVSAQLAIAAALAREEGGALGRAQLGGDLEESLAATKVLRFGIHGASMPRRCEGRPV
jgi:hypothetical protein